MYEINKKTMAIISKNTGYYRTKIIEEDKIKHSPHSPLQLLDHNCIINGASLEGRIKTVKKILRSKTKLPIPIQPKKGIYMFPTISMKNINCVWISYFHVKEHGKRDKKTYIQFNNNMNYFVSTSANQFDLQMKRTSQVIAYFHHKFFLN